MVKEDPENSKPKIFLILGKASRFCNANATWNNKADYSNCTTV